MEEVSAASNRTWRRHVLQPGWNRFLSSAGVALVGADLFALTAAAPLRRSFRLLPIGCRFPRPLGRRPRRLPSSAVFPASSRRRCARIAPRWSSPACDLRRSFVPLSATIAWRLCVLRGLSPVVSLPRLPPVSRAFARCLPAAGPRFLPPPQFRSASSPSPASRTSLACCISAFAAEPYIRIAIGLSRSFTISRTVNRSAVTSVPSRHNLRPRTWVTARNHRRITAPHTRTFNHGAALGVCTAGNFRPNI